MAATTQIQRHIVGKGNRALVAKDTPVYQLAGGRIHYNVAPGQFVAYFESSDGQIPLAIEAADITSKNVHRVRFGVGYSTNGVTVDAIRYLGTEKIGNCDIEHMSVASPKCGNPAVRDFYFDCVSCDETYTIAVGVDDNFTRSFAPLQKSYAEYFGSYVPDCTTCDGCDTEVDCKDIVHGLVESIRGDRGVMIGDKPYPDYRKPDLCPPFHITAICPVSRVYCLSFTDPDSECEKCETVSAITEVTIGGTAYPLVGTVLPDDTSQTARVQLQSVVDQINQLFDDNLGLDMGRAYLTGVNASSCCPLQLHVNTSDDTFAITGLTPAEDYNPFDVGQPGEGFSCGIRVIAAPIEGDCSCYIDKAAAFYGANIRIEARGDGFQDSKEVAVQNMELPGQFGRLIQWMEVAQDRGGSGRNYSAGHQGGTFLGVPRDDSRYVASYMAECEEDYCSYYIRSREHIRNQASGKPDSFLIDSYIHVPSGDDVTQTAVEEFLTLWADLSITCADEPVISCTPLDPSC